MVFRDNREDVPIHEQLQECLFPISCFAQGAAPILVVHHDVHTMVLTDDLAQSSSLGLM